MTIVKTVIDQLAKFTVVESSEDVLTGEISLKEHQLHSLLDAEKLIRCLRNRELQMEMISADDPLVITDNQHSFSYRSGGCLYNLFLVRETDAEII
jgi:hypothetical protein